jgi:hypothetical protein
MKKLLILGLLIICHLSCKSQSIVPLETKINYRNEVNGIPETITYFKDINHLLDKYAGTWQGTYNNNNFEFIISKYTSVYEGLSEDELLIRFLIKNNTGEIVEDTRSELNVNCSIVGDYIKNSYYSFNYYSNDSKCGKSGSVFITIVKNTNNMQMKLFLEQDPILLSEEVCPNGRDPQVLPLEQILLTKK